VSKLPSTTVVNLPSRQPYASGHRPKGETVLDRRKRFEAAHPEIEISTPLVTLSGQWEVSIPGEGTAGYDHGAAMMNALEDRYGS
jgi:hypothetical protein